MTCILLSRSIGGVFVDVVISEEHTAGMEIAEHPVERGAKISDHAWRTPYRVVLDGVIDGARGIASYQALLAVQEAAEPFSLVTGLKVYANMLVKELTATRDPEHSRVLKFTCECQEVIIVSTESGAAPGATADGSLSGTDAAKATTQRGQVSARPVTGIPAQTNTILNNAIAVD